MGIGGLCGNFANYSAQNLRRQKSPIFVYIFQTFRRIQRFGAGEGNRTLVVSLGSFCSTIELHPHFNHLAVILCHFLQWFLQEQSRAPPLPRSVALVNGVEAKQCEPLMADNGQAAFGIETGKSCSLLFATKARRDPSGQLPKPSPRALVAFLTNHIRLRSARDGIQKNQPRH